MNMKKLAVGLVMGLIMVVAIGSTEAAEIQVSGSYSATYVSTAIDTNGDRTPAVLVLFKGNSNLGPFTAEGVSESPSTTVPATCPNGNEGFEISYVIE